MKRFYLFKTLLVVAGMLVGSNVWAESLIFTEDFSDENYNVTWGGTAQGGISPSVSNGVLSVANGSSSGDRSAYIALGNNAYTGCCRLTFDMAMTKSNWSGKNNNLYVLPSATTARYPSTADAALIVTQANDGAITIAGESVGTYDGTTLTYDLYLNTITGKAKVIVKNGATTIKTISYSTTATGINTLHLTFNKNNGAFAIDNISLYSLTAPAFTLSSSEEAVPVGNTATVDVSDITGTISVSSDNENAATASYNNGIVTINGVAAGVAYITVTGSNDGLEISKVITATVGTVATTNVTINYKSGNTSIADPVTINDVTIGSNLTASDIPYDDVIYGTGVRYVNPTPDQTIPYTVVEDGVININYTSQAAVTNVKKIVKAGSVTVSTTDVAQDGKYVGDNIYFSYPLYVNYNGTLYTKTANNNTYSQSFTLTGTDQECVLAYAATNITNVVYHSEGEYIEGATSTSDGSNMSARSSNQQCGYTTSDLTLINLPAGSYKATVVMYSNSSAGATLHFQYGDTPYDEKESAATNWGTHTEEFSISSASDFKWLTSGDSKNGLDFIYIQKTGVPATISAVGWATLYTDYALDFSGVEGLTAYTAALSGSTVTLTEVTNVPAGTGVVLRGAANTYSIPVTASSATAKGDLTGSTTEATAYDAISGKDLYMLALNSNNEVQFTKVTSGEIAAGKAYLPVSNGGGAKMRVVFADNATSINGVESKKAENGVMYNLAGQRVGKDYRGIVIVNGKKVMNK